MRLNIWLFAAIFVSMITFNSQIFASDRQVCKRLTLQSVTACRRLSEQEDSDGLAGLGFLYLDGIGVPQDDKKSFEFMLSAAMLGSEIAQSQVGLALANGQGVKQDYEEAYAWFLIAINNGNEEAQQGIDYLSQNGLVTDNRLTVITQRANELYSKTKKQKGYQFAPAGSEIPVSGVVEYCEMVMSTVDVIIFLKKKGEPRSSAQQLMIGMTDRRAISMMNGVIDWVWSIGIPEEQMHGNFKDKCLKQSQELGFMFQ